MTQGSVCTGEQSRLVPETGTGRRGGWRKKKEGERETGKEKRKRKGNEGGKMKTSERGRKSFYVGTGSVKKTQESEIRNNRMNLFMIELRHVFKMA